MSSSVISRMAPTPSGWLHLGNIANFLLIEKIIQNENGKLQLRIDDCDNTRTRDEYIQHIFQVLEYLSINYDLGPKDIVDFKQSFSQTTRKDYYFERLKEIQDHTFVCECSRKEIGEGLYPGTCRNKKLQFKTGEHSIRLKTGDAKFGDVVIWRKDDGPAYHWVSVIDDLDNQINLIVRGEDLVQSTELQMIMAKFINGKGFSGVRFYHHPLIVGADGNKLSKTNQSLSILESMNKKISAENIRADISQLIEPWFKNYISNQN